MLAQPAMAVVFAPDETISLGMRERITAGEHLLRWEPLTCHRDELDGDIKMKRGKPRKRETQIW